MHTPAVRQGAESTDAMSWPGGTLVKDGTAGGGRQGLRRHLRALPFAEQLRCVQMKPAAPSNNGAGGDDAAPWSGFAALRTEGEDWTRIWESDEAGEVFVLLADLLKLLGYGASVPTEAGQRVIVAIRGFTPQTLGGDAAALDSSTYSSVAADGSRVPFRDTWFLMGLTADGEEFARMTVANTVPQEKGVDSYRSDHAARNTNSYALREGRYRYVRNGTLFGHARFDFACGEDSYDYPFGAEGERNDIHVIDDEPAVPGDNPSGHEHFGDFRWRDPALFGSKENPDTLVPIAEPQNLDGPADRVLHAYWSCGCQTVPGEYAGTLDAAAGADAIDYVLIEGERILRTLREQRHAEGPAGRDDGAATAARSRRGSPGTLSPEAARDLRWADLGLAPPER